MSGNESVIFETRGVCYSALKRVVGADADRFIESWNACHEVPTDQLEPGMVARLLRENGELKAREITFDDVIKVLSARRDNETREEYKQRYSQVSGKWGGVALLWAQEEIDHLRTENQRLETALRLSAKSVVQNALDSKPVGAESGGEDGVH